jgi:hypothetical protein
MDQPHDAQLGCRALTRNLGRSRVAIADRGDDWDGLRFDSREVDVRPVIKTGSSIRLTQCTALDDHGSDHQRPVVGAVFVTLDNETVTRSRHGRGSDSSANPCTERP